MTQALDVPRAIRSLAELAGRYDTIFCDVWGVVHNGVHQHPEAVAALRAMREAGVRVVLLTNSPRPCEGVRRQIGKLGVDPESYDAIVTSGDATRAMIAEGPPLFFHVGTSYDRELFEGLAARPASEADAQSIVVTGLFDDETETAEDYRPLLERMAARGLPMICANPDLVVHRGDKLIVCAGALGQLYASLGGRVHLAGKPHRPIYEVAVATLGGGDPGRVLCIGDGLPTDVKGANDFGADCLFITGGIHRDELDAVLADAPRLAEALGRKGLTARYTMAMLA